jgi:hypothetical protein
MSEQDGQGVWTETLPSSSGSPLPPDKEQRRVQPAAAHFQGRVLRRSRPSATATTDTTGRTEPPGAAEPKAAVAARTRGRVAPAFDVEAALRTLSRTRRPRRYHTERERQRAKALEAGKRRRAEARRRRRERW